MTVTTIKVSTHTRDRLKAQAAAAHLSLGDHLARLADEGDRAVRFAQLRSAITQQSSEDRSAYEVDRDSWLGADLGA